MLLEISGEITPERIKRQQKQKQHPVVDVTGDGSKVRCCKEQYCIGTWNVRYMNQGKLEVDTDSCKSMYDSCQCMAKTTTIL